MAVNKVAKKDLIWALDVAIEGKDWHLYRLRDESKYPQEMIKHRIENVEKERDLLIDIAIKIKEGH